MAKYTFHLLGNAHLDPVWLWDWREGFNEGITTVRTMLDLMDERPEMTLIRGESAIYQFVEEQDPATFARLRAQVEAGRWDVVGGTYIQPDTNMPATETLARQFLRGQRYFRERFGRAPEVAWAADSFGHSAGFPEILAQAGMRGFAFTRPNHQTFPFPLSPFWWESPAGSRVLAYRPIRGWYGSERDDVVRRLNAHLEAAAAQPLRNIGVFYGLGNHGGGPSRRQLDDILTWAAAHPEVEVVHSGLHRLFAALFQEEPSLPGGFPTHAGDLGFCLRGCYASVAKFKFPYRLAEAHLSRAEKTDAAIGAALGVKPNLLENAWESILFNSFHDILPGSSIERAYEDQLAWLSIARHEAHGAELRALNALAAQVDTTVAPVQGDNPTRVPFLVWNPLPQPFCGPVEVEVSADYRPIWTYQGRSEEAPFLLLGPDRQPIPFQRIRTEHSSIPGVPWRVRVVFTAEVPALGWAAYELGLAVDEPASPTRATAVTASDNAISNARYAVRAEIGSETLEILHEGNSIFGAGGLSLVRVEDLWGSWGGMEEEESSIYLNQIQERWRITETALLESGPERATLWVRFAGEHSRLDLTCAVTAEGEHLDLHARVFWNERCSRLKLVFPAQGKSLFEVPGGVVERGPLGEVPGGRWVCVGKGNHAWGLATNGLYGFDQTESEFRATVIRASRYANDAMVHPTDEPWRPAVDAGELCFRFRITKSIAQLPCLAAGLEQPPIVQTVVPSPGALPRTGSFMEINPPNVQLSALKHASDGQGTILRLQETAGQCVTVVATWLGQPLDLGEIPAYGLRSYRLTRVDGTWKAESANIQERSAVV